MVMMRGGEQPKNPQFPILNQLHGGRQEAGGKGPVGLWRIGIIRELCPQDGWALEAFPASSRPAILPPNS